LLAGTLSSFKLSLEFILQFFLTQDKFIIETPGGGGYGKRSKKSKDKIEANNLPYKSLHTFTERGSVFDYRKTQESG